MRRVMRAPLLLGPAVALACGPESGDEPSAEARAYAKAICTARVDCGCASHFSDDEACRDALAARFDDLLGTFAVDRECFEELHDSLPDCGSVQPSTPERCSLVVGTRAEGETCSPHLELPVAWINECADGLACVSGICLPPPGAVQGLRDGSACRPSVPTSCGSFDLYCGDDSRCHVVLAEGVACSSPYACDGGLTCSGFSEGAGTCTRTPDVGEPCDPLDYLACFNTAVISRAFCNPATHTCEAERGPAICEALNEPPAWP